MSSGEPLRLVFAGGGTGGHLYPAIAIADEVSRRQPEAEITFIGTENSLESRVVPGRGYRFEPISVSGFKRAFSPKNLWFFGKLAVSLVQSFRLLGVLKPNVVVGTGGYVCGPPLYVASLLGIPTLIQEQNSYPGVTTRLLAGRVREVHLTFERTKRFLRRTGNVFVTGNPTRAVIGGVDRPSAAAALGLEAARATLLVFGGSQGAASINNIVLGILRDPDLREVQMVWLTGAGEYERVLSAVHEGGEVDQRRVRIFPYYERMELMYAVADLALCRAGATTIAELTRAGVPSVLVPYPHAAADHQTENAKSLAASGAAVLVPDQEAPRRLPAVIRELVHDPSRLQIMAGRARAQGSPRATELLADAVLRLAKV
jgi:UDP-N-acetylglucosamine--N-acetylmuramyl-(pentapeptide) pyrophosphoryl-undecaprenol N-acetylglucosamine transferase